MNSKRKVADEATPLRHKQDSRKRRKLNQAPIEKVGNGETKTAGDFTKLRRLPDDEVEGNVAQTELTTKNVLQTYLGMYRLLLKECVMKMCFSRRYTDLETLDKTLDELQTSPDLRGDLILLVPSFVDAISRLTRCKNAQVHSKARAIASTIFANVFPGEDESNKEEMLTKYHALSEAALAESPHYNAALLAEEVFGKKLLKKKTK